MYERSRYLHHHPSSALPFNFNINRESRLKTHDNTRTKVLGSIKHALRYPRPQELRPSRQHREQSTKRRSNQDNKYRGYAQREVGRGGGVAACCVFASSGYHFYFFNGGNKRRGERDRTGGRVRVRGGDDCEGNRTAAEGEQTVTVQVLFAILQRANQRAGELRQV